VSLKASRAQLLGPVRLLPGPPAIAERDIAAAAWWLRPVARWLAAREARVLALLAGEPGVPRLIHWDGRRLTRTCIAGRDLAATRGADRRWFRSARRLLGRLHRRGIAHNDLAREPNWLVTPDGAAGIIDFELAWHDARRGRLYRLLAREDLRHLLKHKRSFCPAALTARERALLSRPSYAARLWRVTMHPLGRALRRVLPEQ
jgi:RIO-like serine/threonine protein kinase